MKAGDVVALDPNAVISPFKKLRKTLRRLDAPSTPKQVHDIRTRTRKIESTLAALPEANRRNERKLLKHTTKVRRRAGKVRDMDVLSGYIKNLNVDGEQDCITQLTEHLGAQRYKFARKLTKEVKRRRPQLNSRLKKTTRKLRNAFDPKTDGKLSELSREAASDVLRLSAELRQPTRLNKNNLHPYRLKVKELRYVLQNTNPQPDEDLIDTLGEVKNAIGEWHDWVDLIAIAEKLLDNQHPGCKLIRELRNVSEERYEQALSAAERMRKQYFPPKRQGKPHESPKPILIATDRLAA